jgi:hypothetical protein
VPVLLPLASANGQNNHTAFWGFSHINRGLKPIIFPSSFCPSVKTDGNIHYPFLKLTTLGSPLHPPAMDGLCGVYSLVAPFAVDRSKISGILPRAGKNIKK